MNGLPLQLELLTCTSTHNHTHRHKHTCATATVWESEDNLENLVLHFHYVGPRDESQGFRLGGKHLCPLSNLASPHHFKMSNKMAFHTTMLSWPFHVDQGLVCWSRKYELSRRLGHTSPMNHQAKQINVRPPLTGSPHPFTADQHAVSSSLPGS